VTVSVVLLRPGLGLTVRPTIPAGVPPAFKVAASIPVSHTFLLSNDSIKIYRDRLAKQLWSHFSAKRTGPSQRRTSW
jgi:hypothetical protein